MTEDMKQSIDEIQREIIDEFALLDDWMDRYELIIEMGGNLPPMPAEDKVPENLIEGCQSRVWIKGEMDAEGCLQLRAESDALIVKGIVAMLLRVLSGQKPEAIQNAQLFFIEELGLHQHLSPTRSNGLASMVTHIKLLALKSAQ